MNPTEAVQLKEAPQAPLAVSAAVQKFELMQRQAKLYSNSDLVPAHFRGKVANTFIALQVADRLRADQFMVLQSLYVVHGQPGWKATMMLSLANSMGPFDGPIEFDVKGSGAKLSVRAFAKLRGTDRVVRSMEVSMALAEAEGWSTRNGNKYRTMPEQMLCYRAATFLIRLYCPEVLLGMSTAEELQDMGPRTVEYEDLGSGSTIRDQLNSDEEPDVAPPAEPAPTPLSDPAVGGDDGDDDPFAKFQEGSNA